MTSLAEVLEARLSKFSLKLNLQVPWPETFHEPVHYGHVNVSPGFVEGCKFGDVFKFGINSG